MGKSSVTPPVALQPVSGQPGRHGHRAMSPVGWGSNSASGERLSEMIACQLRCIWFQVEVYKILVLLGLQ